jgi:hypothetical protein
MEKLRDSLKLYLVVSKLFPISDFLDNGELKKHYKCPFHNDITPSAKLYTDEKDGIERLFCYSGSCRKQYTSYNYIKDIIGVSPLGYLVSHEKETRVSIILSTFDKVGEDNDLTKIKIIESCKSCFEIDMDLSLFINKIYGLS